jgi:hypothetical protein
MPSLRVKTFRQEKGESWKTPKEMWGFRRRAPGGDPYAIARRFVRDNREVLGELTSSRMQLESRTIVRSLGARHVILSQRLDGVLVYRGYVSLHIANDGSIYLLKNRAVPRHVQHRARGKFRLSPAQIARHAREAAQLTIRECVVRPDPERFWYPNGDLIEPAWRVRVRGTGTRPYEGMVYVQADHGGLLNAYDNLAAAGIPVRLFEPNPVVTLGHWHGLYRTEPYFRTLKLKDAAYVPATLEDLTPNGKHLDGLRASTRPTRDRVERAELSSTMTYREPGFLEVMAYHHVSRAARWIEDLGYTGDRAFLKYPIRIDVRALKDDNSQYNDVNRHLEFGTGRVDDVTDAEVVVHEFGHLVQDAICPKFGIGHEAWAIGEGFGDYLAATMFAPLKPEPFTRAFASWDGIAEGGRPPCVRRLDSRKTFAAFEDVDDYEHENGEIWSATLWDIRTAVGPAIANRLALEHHFQLEAGTKFARAARAILDADRNLFDGHHVAALRRVFKKRRIGPVD